MNLPEYPESPAWSANNKRIVIVGLTIAAVLLLYRVRGLLLPVVLAGLLAYLVEPLVKYIHVRTRVPRILVIIVIYLLIVAMLVAIPVSAIPPLWVR
ncbi:MAG: AI-2E family transporter [Chloroflexi bacterium]|nr:AI-2E family transporter [Chloroflexota bacterium]